MGAALIWVMRINVEGGTPMVYHKMLVLGAYTMKKKRNIGQEILEGLSEIKKWNHGNIPLKTTHISLPTADDVVDIRQNLGLSQKTFSIFMGISVATLRNWEQGRREPHGSARSLLLIAKKVPSAFLKAFQLSKKAA